MSDPTFEAFRQQLEAFKKEYPQASPGLIKEAIKEAIAEQLGVQSLVRLGEFSMEEMSSFLVTACLEDLLSDIPFRVHTIAASSTKILSFLEGYMPDQLATFSSFQIEWPVLMSPAKSSTNAALKTLARLGVGRTPLFSFDAANFGRAPRKSKSPSPTGVEGLANKWVIHAVQMITLSFVVKFANSESKTFAKNPEISSLLPFYEKVPDLFAKIEPFAKSHRFQQLIKSVEDLPMLTKESHEKWFPLVWEWILLETYDKPECDVELLKIGYSFAQEKSVGLEFLSKNDSLAKIVQTNATVRANVHKGIKSKLKRALKRIAAKNTAKAKAHRKPIRRRAKLKKVRE